MKNTQKKAKKTIVEICLGIFANNGNKPLYVKSIYSAMRQRQWKTEGKTPYQTISSKLRLDERFEKTAPNTFRLRSAAVKSAKTKK